MELAVRVNDEPRMSEYFDNFVDVKMPTIAGPVSLILKRSRVISNGELHWVVMPKDEFTFEDPIYTVRFPHLASGVSTCQLHKDCVSRIPASVLHMRYMRQEVVAYWVSLAFGKQVYADPKERMRRLVEEMAELAQAEGLSEEEFHKIAQVMYSKPVGNVKREVGGVGISLLAYCHAKGFDADELEVAELTRVYNKPPSHFTDRQQSKADDGIAMPPSIGDGI